MGLEDRSITELKEQIERDTKDLDWHRLMVEDSEKNIAAYQVELDRRTLATYWEAHPKLTPVAVGDKLLITQEFIDHKEAVAKQGHTYDLGEIYSIQSIYGEECYIETHTSVTGCPTSLASNMRRAYLEQQPETKSNHESE